MLNDIARLTTALADRYTIEREIGYGGMATVYLATDLRHHRQVAVKVLREDLTASMGGARFLREIEIAAQLQHPHILPLLDSGEVAGFLYYVMPYITGQSLRDRLVREGEFPVQEAVRIVAEVVDALAHAHERGVVHRDIKPDNIMLSGRHALVMDFGVAKALSEATDRSPLTSQGVTLGTPAYMAPEQAAADPLIDHRADLYAVGAMAYEMLTGEPPFTGISPQQVLAAHVTDTPRPLTGRRPGIPAALDRVLMQCLAKRPADRPQSATALLSALEGLLTPTAGTPVVGTAVAAQEQRWKKWRIAAVVAVLLLAVTWAFVSSGNPGGSASDAGTVEARRRLVAVLPFVSDSVDQSFSEGLTEEILDALSGVPGLTVRARAASFRFRDRNPDLSVVAAALDVGSVVTGSVQRVGDTVRVRVQLQDAETAAQLWAAHYDREMRSLFAVEDEISRAIADTLRAHFGAGDQVLVRMETAVPDAHRRHLQAQALVTRADEASLLQAIALDSEAVVLDPQYVQAWAGMAAGLTALADVYRAPSEVVPRARAAAMRAIDLADSLPVGHLELGGIAIQWDWDFPQARREITRAIAMNERSSRAHFLFGLYLAAAERDFAGSEREFLRAQALDPLDPWIVWFRAEIAAGRRDTTAALRLGREVLRIDPTFYYGSDVLAMAYASAGRWQDCVDRYAAHLDSALSPQLAICRLHLGDSVAARQTLARLEAESRHTYVRADAMAELNLELGNRETALDWLERAVEQRSAFLMALAWSYTWDPIRTEPRFVAITREIGFPWASP